MNHTEESSVPPEGTRDPEEGHDALPVEGEHSRPDECTPESSAVDGEAPAAPDLTPEEEAIALSARLADKLKRVEAGFMNETKRIRRQAEQDRKYSIEKVVVDLLPVVDALHGARDSLGEGEAADAVRAGLTLVDKQLSTVLERYGVSTIEALGKPFDPAQHQAMMMVEHPEYEPQTVCEVLRAGYELNGRIVRAAEVLVVKAAPQPQGSGRDPAGDQADAPSDAPGGSA
jgi:molecular chaperone GrpE